MDVRCERCQTEYEFDEAQLTEAGVAVKCTTCGNVFKVRRPAQPLAPAPEPAPREWKVRRAGGQPIAVKDLPDLQRWIVERRVSREDEVSLTGEAWRQLGSMPELASFFEVVEAAERARAPAPPVRQGPGSASWEDSPQPLPRNPAAEPAWTKTQLSPPDDELDSEDLKHVRGSKAPLVLLLLALVAAGGGAAYWFTRTPAPKPKPAVAQAVAPTPPPPPVAAPPPVAIAPVPPPAPAVPVAPAPPPVPAAVAAKEGAAAEGDGSAGRRAEAAGPEHPADQRPEAKAKPRRDAEATPEAKAKPGHDFNWYLNRGHKLLDTHPKDALALFAQASELDASSPEPDSGRGLAYSNLEKWDQAIAAFKDALKKSPEYTEAVMGLAEAYRYKGSKDKAIIYYRKYLDLTPDGPDAPAAKAQIESLKGE